METIKRQPVSTHEGNVIIDVNDSLSVTINRDFQKFVEGRADCVRLKTFYVYNDQDDNYTMINEKGMLLFVVIKSILIPSHKITVMPS
ncbi:MAG: hypothetical protein IPN79_06220 [Saprospiraceae bacterium]|nr:hypothetical protein [Saprospiraceae bacterium]